MRDKLMEKQKIRELSIILVITGIMVMPLYSGVLLAGAIYAKLDGKRKRRYIMFLIAGILSAVLYTILCGKYFGKWTAISWLFGMDPVRLIIVFLATIFFCCVDYSETADEWLIKEEQEKTSASILKGTTINFENRTHEFVVGTTGSGKTTLLLYYIRDSLIKGEPLFILSGKNGTDDPFSLISAVKKMAETYGRQLHIVSMNPAEQLREHYNPFKNMDVVELADALCNASNFTEPHYKYCLSTWIKAIGECLKIMEIPFSLKTIVDFYDWNSFSVLLKEIKQQKKMADEQIQEYLKLEDICKTAALTRTRFLNLFLGEGSEIWGNDGVCAQQCRTDNAVFFCDLDSFKYSDFTDTIGKFFANDIRNVISCEKDPAQKKRIIMDELGAYASEQILPLFSQSRAYGYQIIVATQSIADIGAISDSFAERILENCGQYGILQLNSSDDADRMARIIGTRTVIETTRKSQGNFLDQSWAGSKKVVQQFKVSPDVIKELEPLEALLYDKKQPNKVQLLKLSHVS